MFNIKFQIPSISRKRHSVCRNLLLDRLSNVESVTHLRIYAAYVTWPYILLINSDIDSMAQRLRVTEQDVPVVIGDTRLAVVKNWAPAK